MLGNDSIQPIFRSIRLSNDINMLLRQSIEFVPENKELMEYLKDLKVRISNLNSNGFIDIHNRYKEPEKQYEPATDAEIKSNYERMAVAWEIIDGVTDFLTKHGYFHRKLDNELENHIKLEQMLNDNQKRNESKD